MKAIKKAIKFISGNNKLNCKNNEQHRVHYYKNINQTVCMVCGIVK